MGGWRSPAGEGFPDEIRVGYARRNKSYVPQVVRDDVTADIPGLLAEAQGRKAASAFGTFIDGDPNGMNAGDWAQSDDVTPDLYWWDIDENGKPAVMRGQWLPFIDLRSLKCLGFALIPSPQYTGVHIRNLCTKMAEDIGLPRRGYKFENGIWKNAHLVTGHTSVPWDKTRRGLRGLGLAVQRTKEPRGKLIERVIGILNSNLGPWPGWCSSDERKRLPEKCKKQLAVIRSDKAHPAEFLLSKSELADRLDLAMQAYNAERQQGKYLDRISPNQGYEQFFTTPLTKPDERFRHVIASDVHQLTVRPNGIFLPYLNGAWFKNERTGQMVGREVLVYVNPENFDYVAVTDMDENNAFVVPRATKVPKMDAPKEVLEKALRENAQQDSYHKTLYRTIAAHSSAEFEQRQFRKNIVSRKTLELGEAIRTQTAELESERIASRTSDKRIKRLARDAGVASELIHTDVDGARGAARLAKAGGLNVEDDL
jgi:hypothetical protein